MPPHGLLHQELIVDHRLESFPVKFLEVFMYYSTLEEKVINLGLLAGWLGSLLNSLNSTIEPNLRFRTSKIDGLTPSE